MRGRGRRTSEGEALRYTPYSGAKRRRVPASPESAKRTALRLCSGQAALQKRNSRFLTRPDDGRFGMTTETKAAELRRAKLCATKATAYSPPAAGRQDRKPCPDEGAAAR